MSSINGSHDPKRRLATKSKMSHNGSLEIIEHGNSSEVTPSTSRPTSSSRRAPPISGARQNSFTGSGRSTPVIEKSLVSVRRKDLTGADNFVMDKTAMLSDDDGDDILAMANLTMDTSLSKKPINSKPSLSQNRTSSPTSPMVNGASKAASDSKTKEEESSSDESSDDEDRKAPNQLIMEFLQCVMANDTENGLKLCKMILLYEPSNSQALKFLPLLEEKKVQDEAGNEADDDENSDEDSGASEEESGDDSDDDSDEESDDSSSDEEEEEAKDPETAASSSNNNKDWAPVARFVISRTQIIMAGDAYSVTHSVLEAAQVLDPGRQLSCLITDRSNRFKLGNEFIHWAHSHSQLKVQECAVPDGIFPVGMTGMLADVKVYSKGPDDCIYDGSKEIRQRVARGNTFLKLDGGDWDCVVYALKKFTGGMGDDDDRSGGGDKHVWKQYFTKSLDEASSVISLKKANGEAAHLACVKLNQVPYIILGSKNVHMLIRRRSDIEKYEGMRYQVATEIAHSVLDFLETLSKERVMRLLDFLHETRMTAVFEILNPTHQHVEDLSYLGDKSALKFITWTSTDLSAGDELCVLPPDVSIKVASELGFDSVEYSEISAVEAESHMLAIRKHYGFEGEVFYYLDASRNVIGLLKKKTTWYIICRAIRERVRNSLTVKSGFDPEDTKKRIKKRIKEIQRWLNLCDESTEKWIDLGLAYLEWVVGERKKGTVDRQKVADLFPVTWTQFLNDSGMTDKIEYSEADIS